MSHVRVIFSGRYIKYQPKSRYSIAVWMNGSFTLLFDRNITDIIDIINWYNNLYN